MVLPSLLLGAVQEPQTKDETTERTERQSLVARRMAKAPRELRRPEYGLDAPDIVYPAVFRGDWAAESTCLGVAAPLGAPLFGGETAYAAAQQDVGDTLRYDVRFLANGIADRPFNTRSLVAATLADDDALAALPSSDAFDPNNLKFKLTLGGAAYAASLRMLGRYVSSASSRLFETSEFVRQSVSREGGLSAALSLEPASVKDIETLCSFTVVDDDTIACDQRTATWLFASDQLSAAKVAAADGRPVDVRRYRLVYRRRRMHES